MHLLQDVVRPLIFTFNFPQANPHCTPTSCTSSQGKGRRGIRQDERMKETAAARSEARSSRLRRPDGRTADRRRARAKIYCGGRVTRPIAARPTAPTAVHLLCCCCCRASECGCRVCVRPEEEKSRRNAEVTNDALLDRSSSSTIIF